jgi:hypothetical protein
VLWRIIDARHSIRACRDAAELGREKNTLTACLFQEAPDQFLIVANAVEVGRIEEVDALIKRALHRLHRLAFVGGAIGLRHANASEPECRNGLAGASKR